MVKCDKVLQELSNYIDEDLDPALRREINEHLRSCHRCTVLVDSTRKMLYVVGDERVFEIPIGFGERLHSFLSERLGN
ncbi:MAG TPA: zf-HC2 domain-containing protein [Terriglobales bacterium]|jgi:anti-sigma factor RsiW|nr:zf-HC2 domain-containing protein [Terriglobales bacterium]